jgi:hypothetical protein
VGASSANHVEQGFAAEWLEDVTALTGVTKMMAYLQGNARGDGVSSVLAADADCDRQAFGCEQAVPGSGRIKVSTDL